MKNEAAIDKADKFYFRREAFPSERKGAGMAYNEKIYKGYRSRVIKNVNFVNDIFYFTVLFGK